jgi:hypothetical protein
MHKRWLVLFVASSSALVALPAISAAAQETAEPTAGGPVSAEELASLERAVPPELFGTPSVEVHDALLPSGLWQCNAWSSTGFGTPTFWISYDLSYAQFQALSACSSFNLTTCFFQCFPL